MYDNIKNIKYLGTNLMKYKANTLKTTKYC